MRVHLIVVTILVGFCISLPIEKPSHLRNVFHNIHASNDMKCDVCLYAVKFLNLALSAGVGKGNFVKLANYVCHKFGIETDRICVTAINEWTDEVWGLLVNGIAVPNQICWLALGETCVNKTEWFKSWNITIPKPTKSTPTSSAMGIKTGAGPTMKVLHISDTHLDNDYMEGSLAKCKEPLCCRRQDGPAGEGQPKAGKYGYAGFCDTNHLMLETMFQHMKDNHNDAEYILWTGDVPAHNVWNQSRTAQQNSIAQAGNIIRKYFPSKKVFPTLGNHESAPVNSFPPPEIWSWTIPSTTWLFDAIAEVWGTWLPEECKETIRKGGYYTALARKGLRIVSLNTNYGHGDNWWLSLKSKDPAGQLQWLTQVLLQAEKDGEKVHIIGHVPTNELLQWWSFNYYKIVNRFQHTIMGQFFGHTHHDEFRIFYDMKTSKTPISVEYLGPSVTTFHELYPGYRVYDMDATSANSSMSVVNHHTYILDLTKVQQTGKAEFELEYSAQEKYKMKNLSPAAWNDLLGRMVEDDDLFQYLYKAFYKQHIQGKCEDDCKKNTLCSMKNAVGGYNFCKFDRKEEMMYSIWKAGIYNKC